MAARHGYSVTLHRDGLSQPWGLRLVGGCDLGKPIIITRAVAGTPAEGNVKPGDEVLQIGDYDARDLRHQDAQMLFKNAGNSVKLVIYRPTDCSLRTSRECSLDPTGALPRALGVLPEQFDMIGPTSMNKAILEKSHSRRSSVVSPYRQEIEEELHDVTHQPYRTTPLVLPGAKVKKDFGPTESYLRHHPNPMFRQAAPHPLLPHEIAMKQKIAHKQYNSPIGMYSDQNIVDTINQQTASSATPSPVMMLPNSRLRLKKTVVFDPVKSEAYKALQDQEIGEFAQEVTPIPTKVFTPVKKPLRPPHQKISPASVPHPVPGPHSINAAGQTHEEIQQSNTFKRLMHMVQTEGVY